MKAVILSAGAGTRLRRSFQGPKCLISVGAVPLINRYIEDLEASGITGIVIVLGYRMAEVVNHVKTLSVSVPIHLIENPRYLEGSILSLWRAKDWLKGDILVLDGDLYFEKGFLEKAATCRKENFFLIDSGARNDGEAVMVGFKKGKAVEVSRGLRGDFDLMGEWAGGLRLSSEAAPLLREIVRREVDQDHVETGYEFVIPQLFDFIDISYELVDSFAWVEIDFPEDIERAERMVRKQKRVVDRT